MFSRVGMVLVVVVALLAPVAVQADEPVEPAGPTVAWGANITAETGVRTSARATVTFPSGSEPAPFVVVVEKASGEGWAELSRSESPSVDVPVRVLRGRTQLRARLLVADQEVSSDTLTVAGTRARVGATLSMPSRARDYQWIKASVTVRRRHDKLPLNVVAKLKLRRSGEKAWRTVASLRVKEGVKRINLKPRHDGTYKLMTQGTETLLPTTATPRAFDNLPPGSRVVIPRGASRPSVTVPAQPRAARIAADATVSRLSDAVWSSMKGRTWRKGCPVGRGGLRIVRVSYWAFDGYVRRGEIVVRAASASRTKKIFTDLFKAKAPVRSMYRVDRFGYSKSLKGGDDHESMRADNTSGFNCRKVVGNTRYVSPHSYGTSIDINPWENPYRSASGYTPNKSWHKRSKPASVTYRGSGDPVVKVFRKHGFRWLGKADLHHFQD
ncbi:MAG: M15 family peptidase [Actinomycetales bacterium]|nr:MAG: M15 family peptidase [Actinomycetales bacterium]